MFKINRLLVMILTAFFMVSTYTIDLKAYQLITTVESYTEAELVANQYQMDILDYKTSGIVVFETTNSSVKSKLLSMGFYEPSSLSVDARPIPTNSDPYLKDQYAIPMLEISTAWNLTEGSSDLVIAIIDTGIDTDNPEFAGRISPLSYNSRTETVGIAAVEDDNGHGTNVAGVIGAIKGNNIGIAGVLQNASLLIIKANKLDNISTTDDDESNSFSDADVADGIYYAVNHGAHIINLSLGGPSINSIMRDAIKYAVDQGVLVVASSGNSGDSTVNYPAAYDGVISVGSIDESKTISSFSTYNTYVDFVAPGSQIITTSMSGGYVSVSGTSFSAPYLAGVAGLIWSYNPTLTSNDIYQLLQTYAEDLGTVGKDNYYGHGLVKAYQSMTYDTFTVTFETFDGTYIEPIEVILDGTFDVIDPVKTGYTFLGWYKDINYEVPFEVGIDKVTTDMTLYARYQVNQYNVSIYDGTTNIYSSKLDYGTLLNYVPTKENYTFVGYYYDQTFELAYEKLPISENLVLYAKFIRDPFQVTYVVKSEIVYIDYVLEGDSLILYTYESSYPFLGWYTDQTYEYQYVTGAIDDDLTLYGKLNDGTYTVNFFDGNQSIIRSFSVNYDASINMTDIPLKASEIPFDYVFTGWDQSTTNITTDLNVYPLFEAVYNPSYVKLGNSVDTLIIGEAYQEKGLNFTDERVLIDVISNLDETTSGTYVVSYKVYYLDQLVDERTRVVTIIEAPFNLIITLNKGIDTIVQGSTYLEVGAQTNYGNLVISGSVDTETPGVYEIIYSVTYGNKTYQKIRYITVLAQTETNQLAIWYKKEDII